MDYKKEREELAEIIEEIEETLNLPLEEMKQPGFTLSMEDMEALLNRTQEIIDKLNRKANDICAKLGVSREDFSKVTDDPSRFNPQEWEAIQAMRENIDAFHKTLMQTSLQLKNESLIRKKRDEQKKQPLKGRKNWIPL